MISRRCFFLLTTLGLSCVPGHACLHFLEDSPLAPPKPLTLVQKLQQRTSRSEWQQRAQDLKRSADHAWNFQTENNLSVALCHLGQYDEALDRMRTIERTAPGHIETAYNMATALELSGDLQGAKKWLEEGFARERKTTGSAPLDGTEWLHERILDAELAAKTGSPAPDSIAGLDFGAGKTPQMPTQFPVGLNDKPVGFEEASRSLFEQLHERLEFAPAPNPVVGDLLFDLANAQTLQNQSRVQDEETPDQVTPLLQMALDFGSPRAALVGRRFDYYSGKPNWPLIITPLLLALVGAGAWQWSKARREQREWQQIPVAAWQPPKFLPHLEWKEADDDAGRQGPL